MKFYDGLIGHNTDVLYNSTGHRCREQKEIHYRNYFLFVGDNICLGLDKPLEKTFPYIVSKELKSDYYNLSIFNGGFDCFKNNLISWLAQKPKPKAIIIGFEFLNSILKIDQHRINLEYFDYNDMSVKAVMNSANNCGFFLGRKELFNVLLANIVDIPVYQLFLPNKENLLFKNVININYNDDIFDHEKIAQVLLPEMKKRFDTNVVLKP